MTMFEQYTKEVTIETAEGPKTLKIRPLSGKDLPKLYRIMKVMSGLKDSEGMTDQDRGAALLGLLTDEDIIAMHSICLESLVKSYPSEDRSSLDDFASQNLLALIPVFIEINMNQKRA